MNNPPMVSCIMPTANRATFIPNAIRYFLHQDYPNTELIIVDDGDIPIGSLVPQNPRIRYYRIDHTRSVVGVKRNYACELANGDIIMHWDDDDWYAQNWISYQVYVLLTSQAEICGLSQLYFHSPMLQKTWKYIYPSNEQPWVGGATMAYTKRLWKRNPFTPVQVGEDNQFVWYSRARVVSHNYFTGFVSILHPGNTSPKKVENERWNLQEPASIPTVVNSVLDSYKTIFH